MVSKDEAIFSLAKDIMRKIKRDDVKLSNVLLQAAELSHLIGLSKKNKFFSDGSQNAEKSQIYLDTYNSTIEATKDPPISITSANPSEFVGLSFRGHKGNYLERQNIMKQRKNAIQTIAHYRAKTYEFVMKVYYTYLFGQEASSILDDYKKRVPKEILKKMPDLKDSFEVINKNISSTNPREWAAVASECRNILIKLSSQLWKKNDEKFKRPNGDIIETTGEKNKLIAYIDTKISGSKLKKSQNLKLCGIIHEIFNMGGKQKRKIEKKEVSTSVIDTYIFLAELIDYTDLQSVV